MDPEDARELELALRALCAVVGGVTMMLGAWRARLVATIGAPKVVVRAPRRLRWLYVAAAAALAAWLLAANPGVPLVTGLVLLALGVALVLIAPGAQDSLLGSDGVQLGWHARRFADLDEWRLTGDHLRLRLFDEWVAVHAPAELHEELRAQLSAANPDRESSFSR